MTGTYGNYEIKYDFLLINNNEVVINTEETIS